MSNPDLCCPAGESTFLRLKKMSQTYRGGLHRIALRYALERFLFRIFDGQGGSDGPNLLLNPENDVFVSQDAITLKGGMTLVFAEGGDPLKGRSTGDADLHLAAFRGSVEDYAGILRGLLAGPPRTEPDDGVRFDVSSVRVSRDREERSGGTVVIPLQIGRMPLQVKTDVSFDARPMHDKAPVVEYPSILPDAGLAAPLVRRVPFEFMMADKIGAALQYGAANLRLRDYHDMRLVLGRDDLVDDAFLATTLAATLRFKGLEIPQDPSDAPGFGDAFARVKQARWIEEGKAKNYGVGDNLAEVMGWLRERLAPVFAEARAVRDLPAWAFAAR